MRNLLCILMSLLGIASVGRAYADSRGDELLQWLELRGRQVWGEPPAACDDHTFARRLYLDSLGRVPSVSELRDFLEQDAATRRSTLVGQLVFGQGLRASEYSRLNAANDAKLWRRVLLPPGTVVNGMPETLESWLESNFKKDLPLDEMMRQIIRIQNAETSGNYYSLLGSLPENYAGNLSRALLGVRIECAQCHDHPFSNWKQSDFWGLAAFYNDIPRPGEATNASRATTTSGTIEFNGATYTSKYLWSQERVNGSTAAIRNDLATWMTSKDNRFFTSTIVNRVWQMYVGQGLYTDVENLDRASAEERKFLDEFGQKFADINFNLPVLVSVICKSSWYQAVSEDNASNSDHFARTFKVLSPEQIFDSMEQCLHLPVSRVDSYSSRWSGDRQQLVSRLSETTGTNPQDYAAGIPQALLIMNGKMTSDAITPERSRLLRAVTESPFFTDSDRIKTLYLAVLTREPTNEELKTLHRYVNDRSDPTARQHAFGEILWALLNSPEFVLCR